MQNIHLFYTRSDGPVSEAFPLSEYRSGKLTGKPETDSTRRIPEYLLIRALRMLLPELPLPLEFEVNAFGKPILQKVPFHISISHSGNLVLLAVSEDEVGVDLQVPVEESRALAIAARRFTAEESSHIQNNAHPAEEFVRIWTRKEAYLKYIGTGLQTSLNAFSVLKDPGGIYFHDGILEGMSYSVCTKNQKAPEKPIYINL